MVLSAQIQIFAKGNGTLYQKMLFSFHVRLLALLPLLLKKSRVFLCPFHISKLTGVVLRF